MRAPRLHDSFGVSVLLAGTLALLSPTAAGASGVVTNCDDDTQLSSLLAAGGTITFDCGTRTIVLSSTKVITTFVTIDGGGVITLSGDNARRLFVVNAGARLELDDLVIEKGFSKAGDGGAIQNLDTVSVVNCTFRNNATTAEWSGGAIFSSSHLAAYNTTFTNNEAGSGGAVGITSHVNQTNITASRFDHNVATGTGMSSGWGGALLATDGATATVGSSTFTDNHAREGGAINLRSGSHLFADATLVDHNTTSGDGGGINVDVSMAMLTNLTLSRNAGAEGGAINTFAGEVTMSAVTLSDNAAVYGAGYQTFLGTHVLSNVTISGNDASSSGGGIYNSRGAMTLTNVTLAGNTGGNGLTGGIVNGGGGPDPDLKLTNVLIAKGATGTNCGFGVAPTGSQLNLSDDDSCGFGAGRDAVDLMLGPLADNGGTTQTHLPSPGSLAIGNGTNVGCPTTDQRGVPRPQGLLCDVGAVEVAPTPTPTATSSPSRTPSNSATPTRTASSTPTLSPTRSATATISNTPIATATATPTTATSSPTGSTTATAADTPSATPTETPTTATPSHTTMPTMTGSSTPPATSTATANRTATATSVASGTTVPTPTPTASPSATALPVNCAGDCNDSGDVTINELITVINVALGEQPVSACPVADLDQNGAVAIDEILRAVNNALTGCP